MEHSIKTYKKKFDRNLRHIKLILASQRRHMAVREWLCLVYDTKQSVLDFPEEFFCQELPPAPICRAAIAQVFDGFLEDQRLLAMQTSRGFRIPTTDKS